MLKIVALYFCLTIFIVSGNGNASSGVPSLVLNTTPVNTTVSQGTGLDLIPFEPTDKPAPPTSPPNTTTTSTTTPKPNPDPQPNTTTTVKPTTTTTVPTTTSKKPTTTTVVPITTTSSPPVPTPAPAPKTSTWMVNGTNETCIVVQMAVQFSVSYNTTNNKTLWQDLTLPTHENATVNGTCGKEEQTLNITWSGGDDYLVFHFTKNDTISKYYLHHIEAAFATHDFPNIKPNATLNFTRQADQFPTKLSNSYRCAKLQKFGLMRNASNEITAYLEISDLQFQAFKQDKTTGFGTAEDCLTDVPDVVPIAVGCALTVLVIIVLAAYLIGRRRSQARGYLSM